MFGGFELLLLVCKLLFKFVLRLLEFRVQRLEFLRLLLERLQFCSEVGDLGGILDIAGGGLALGDLHGLQVLADQEDLDLELLDAVFSIVGTLRSPWSSSSGRPRGPRPRAP